MGLLKPGRVIANDDDRGIVHGSCEYGIREDSIRDGRTEQVGVTQIGSSEVNIRQVA
jgi:hypothetical protein